MQCIANYYEVYWALKPIFRKLCVVVYVWVLEWQKSESEIRFINLSWLVADCPQCTLGFIQQRVFLIQKQVIFTGKSTPKNTDRMLIIAPYLSLYRHCISAQLEKKKKSWDYL